MAQIILLSDVTEHYVNIDTGCYFGKNGGGKLSAYGLDGREVVVESME